MGDQNESSSTAADVETEVEQSNDPTSSPSLGHRAKASVNVSKAATMLANLPSRNKNSFSKYNSEREKPHNWLGAHGCHSNIWQVVGDTDNARPIVTNNTNIILRYLHNRWTRNNGKRSERVRSSQESKDTETSGSDEETPSNHQPARKMPRMAPSLSNNRSN